MSSGDRPKAISNLTWRNCRLTPRLEKQWRTFEADPNKLLKAVSKVTFRQSQIVNPDLVMVRAARNKVTLNKPIAVGFSFLEISKYIMYQFYYEHLKAKYGDRCTLLFTDTDSVLRN